MITAIAIASSLIALLVSAAALVLDVKIMRELHPHHRLLRELHHHVKGEPLPYVTQRELDAASEFVHTYHDYFDDRGKLVQRVLIRSDAVEDVLHGRR